MKRLVLTSSQMAAYMKIVEIWQVYTAINILLRRYTRFCSVVTFFGCVRLIVIHRFDFSRIKFEPDAVPFHQGV